MSKISLKLCKFSPLRSFKSLEFRSRKKCVNLVIHLWVKTGKSGNLSPKMSGKVRELRVETMKGNRTIFKACFLRVK